MYDEVGKQRTKESILPEAERDITRDSAAVATGMGAWLQ